MLTTVQRIRLYAMVIIVMIISAAIFFGFAARQRLADIRTLNEARLFAYALEQYRQDFWRYPAGNRIDVRKGVVLSENGFAPGAERYYQGGIPSSRVVTYQGDETSYSVNFTLRRAWPEQGLPGSKCQITQLYTLVCAE